MPLGQCFFLHLQAIKINQSLSALGDVIAARAREPSTGTDVGWGSHSVSSWPSWIGGSPTECSLEPRRRRMRTHHTGTQCWLTSCRCGCGLMCQSRYSNLESKSLYITLYNLYIYVIIYIYIPISQPNLFKVECFGIHLDFEPHPYIFWKPFGQI